MIQENFYHRLKFGSVSKEIGNLNSIKDNLVFIPFKGGTKEVAFVNRICWEIWGNDSSVLSLTQKQVFELAESEKHFWIESPLELNWGLNIGGNKSLFVLDYDYFDITMEKIELLLRDSLSFRSAWRNYQYLLENTYTVRSQKGGRHYYFIYDNIWKYKRHIATTNSGIDLSRFLSAQQWKEFQEYCLSKHRAFYLDKETGKPDEEKNIKHSKVLAIDFLLGKHAIVLPSCKFINEKGETTGSYSIHNDVPVKQLSDIEFNTLCGVFNNIHLKKECQPKVIKPPKILKSVIAKKLKDKVISENSELVLNLEEDIDDGIDFTIPSYVRSESFDQERYSRELDMINHSNAYRGWSEEGLRISKRYEILFDKSLTKEELNKKAKNKLRRLELSWILKLFLLGHSKQALENTIRSEFNVNTNSYAKKLFFEEFLNYLQSEIIKPPEERSLNNSNALDAYDCIQLLNKSDVKSILGNPPARLEVLIGIYRLAIRFSTLQLKGISNNIIAFSLKTYFHPTSVASAIRYLRSVKIIDIEYINKGKLRYMKMLSVKSYTQLVDFLHSNNIDMDIPTIETYSADSRTSLHRLKGVGKRGERIYFFVREKGQISLKELYRFFPQIEVKRRSQFIGERVDALIANGYLALDFNNNLSITTKNLSECVSSIRLENRNRKRKLNQNPVHQLYIDGKALRDTKVLFEKFEQIDELHQELVKRVPTSVGNFEYSENDLQKLTIEVAELRREFPDEPENFFQLDDPFIEAGRKLTEIELWILQMNFRDDL